MKILFLTKRRPQNRDLFTRPYGRFYNIPRALAEAGAEVHLVLCSYKDEEELSTVKDGMIIYSRKMWPNLPGFYQRMKTLTGNIRPDVVVGLSDTWYGIIAVTLAEGSGARAVIDAYDNYEAYIPWAKPLHWLWHRALGRAHGLTAAGPHLLDLMCQYNPDAHQAVVPMAADAIFQPLETVESRTCLGLPVERKLVGYLGTADKTRGFDLFLRAMQQLLSKRDDFDLVLSGRTPVNTGLPRARLHQLGYVADELMPALLNSCDLLVCVNKDSAFGNYSYPVKIYEALACRKPVLASKTGPARWILQDDPRLLATVGDPQELAMMIDALLDDPLQSTDRDSSWESSAKTFFSLLEQL